MSDQGTSLQDGIDSLRREGAWRVDPVRFRYLEALAARIPGQAATVRVLLEDRLRSGLADYAARFVAEPGGRAVPAGAAEAACVPLMQLNHHIRSRRPAVAPPAPLGSAADPPELDSVRRFRQAWSSIRTQDQLEEAVARGPANAGPLNSHALVLQSLELMAQLSTDYLRRFITHVETLQWLERAAEAPRASQGRAGKAPRRKPSRT